MRKKPFKIDLTKIKGAGDFPCPKCGTMISPDDETKQVYTVVETIIGEDDYLERMIIKCNQCKRSISLSGFESLVEEEESRVDISDALPKSEAGYRTYHTIAIEGRHLGSMVLEYAQKEDVKAFKRLKKLHVGDPFKCTVKIVDLEGDELKKGDYKEISMAVKKRFKGVKKRDIFVVEVKDGQKNVLGRVSDLDSDELF